MLRIVIVLLLVLVFALGASLGYFNAEHVTFHYVFGTTDVSIAVLVIVTFIVAALLTLLLCGLRILGLHREIRRLRKQVRDSETELKNLRNLPLAANR